MAAMQGDVTTPHARQLFEMQQVRNQIALAEQRRVELELECQMNEMAIGNISTIDDQTRAKIETMDWILHMLRTDLTARERIFAQYLIELKW